MTKENAIKLLKVKMARLANPDFDFERELADLMQFESYLVDNLRLLTWKEVQEAEEK